MCKKFLAIFVRLLSSQIFFAASQSLAYMIVITKSMWIRLGHENKLPQTSLSQVNRKMKSSRIKVGLQFICSVRTTKYTSIIIHTWSLAKYELMLVKLLSNSMAQYVSAAETQLKHTATNL